MQKFISMLPQIDEHQ